MSDHDIDWLDDKLAAAAYLSDDGFTARVMKELPKTRPARAISARQWILFISTAASLGLVLGLIGPLTQTLSANAALYFHDAALTQMLAWTHQPLVLFAAAAGLSTLVTLATIPFLRRGV